jgi:hypothetical protein
MAGYLLDTNHLGQAVTRTSPVRQHLEEVRKSGIRVGTCVPMLCEIEAAAQEVSGTSPPLTHLYRIYHKLGLRNRVELTRRAIEQGWIVGR